MSQVGGAFVTAVPAVPAGSVQAFAGSSAPNGWLLCDGTAVSRTTYSSLFSVVSTTFGVGDGSTTFNVPDLRGRVPMGAGTGTGLNASGTGAPTGTAQTARTRGAWGGEETHLLTTAEMPSHSHNTLNNISGGGSWGSQFVANASMVTDPYVGNTGGGGRHAVVQPFVVLNYIIKWSDDVPRGGMTASWTPPIVTTLPVSPSFGDQVTYAADAANGVYWLLQYDASGTYPWKFIGGPPLSAGGGGYVAVTSVAPTFASISGASVTAALAGDYSVRVEGQVQNQAGYATFLSCSYGATAPSSYEGPIAYSPTAVVDAGGSREARKTLAANDAVVAKGAVNAGTGYIGYTRVLLTPIRVKAA